MPTEVAWVFSLKNKITSLEMSIWHVPSLFLPVCVLNLSFAHNLLSQDVQVLTPTCLGVTYAKSFRGDLVFKLLGVLFFMQPGLPGKIH